VDPRKLNEYDTPKSAAADMKTLQELRDQAERASSVIKLNIETISCLRRQVHRLRTFWPSEELRLLRFMDQLERFKQEHQFALINVSAVIERARTVSEQVRTPD